MTPATHHVLNVLQIIEVSSHLLSPPSTVPQTPHCFAKNPFLCQASRFLTTSFVLASMLWNTIWLQDEEKVPTHFLTQCNVVKQDMSILF